MKGILCILYLLATMQAIADNKKDSRRLYINSDHLVINQEKQQAHFSGQVILWFEDMVVKTTNLEIFYKKVNNKQVIDYIIMPSKLTARRNNMHELLMANSAEYFMNSKELILSGDIVIQTNDLMTDILHVNNISKTYNNRLILNNVSIHLQAGEIVGLFGPNGAGKTTCFSIIIGLSRPDRGELFHNNYNITHLPIYLRAKFGFSYLPQESSIFQGLSVRDNIRIVLEIVESNKEVIEQKTCDLLKEFSLYHLRDVSALALSGGERRRLEIARTLATKPKFIMLDEPLAGIDPLMIEDIKNLIAYLRNRNIGILITDHNVRDTLNIVDRAYVIYNGKVLFEGTPQEITSNSK
ncbi:putative ABC transporter ATP-binding protein, partial [Pseudolycoriella hygida]